VPLVPLVLPVSRALPARKARPVLRGPQVHRGPQGATGAQGPSAASTVQTSSSSSDDQNGLELGLDASCPDSGEVAISGGVKVTGAFNGFTITEDTPVFGGGTLPNAWNGTVAILSGATITMTVWVICES
jgi:hypothetical protein